ncbi:phosphatidylserine decarboxylase [Rhodococcus sp. Leaf7]|uniref:phosphatidylserine decarboxylase n=1 Tax=unclassified Rhodococcus (in: high G+C Gram-positive bacteria) TaxID=192944 RepID=UPI0006F8D564|nr:MULTISPECIES: phosphatidylserine decarboxylase [unclassified Rhodococcus (in: high G+C Gram-positive bacteria)]KQU03009.1 phosphatidylserine decarboxylase [Rhodococcus sp. Leaf7]KQU38809.1 phosphatidylserine decarboxylase [Rhodococcus sp. Leaf247]
MTSRLPAVGVLGSAAAALLVGGYSYWRTAAFLRDPDRTPPADPSSIVSAADGYVTYVKRVERGELPIAVKKRRSIRLSEYAGVESDASGWLIGTYMTEHSVHRNRAPVGGTVVLREHRGAAPFNRSMARMTANLVLHRTPYDEGCDYLLTNERLTIGIRHDAGSTVFVTQIADLWVDRIVAHTDVDDRLERGEQYGLIRFGSQCDVFLPDDLLDGDDAILVRPGQYVWAGESVVARARVQAHEQVLGGVS